MSFFGGVSNVTVAADRNSPINAQMYSSYPQPPIRFMSFWRYLTFLMLFMPALGDFNLKCYKCQRRESECYLLRDIPRKKKTIGIKRFLITVGRLCVVETVTRLFAGIQTDASGLKKMRLT